ncbi:MAG: phosphatidylserine decarboxylase family protein [Bacteroidales bacterium]|jgi:phosphatidylserine decarboxylase|nr:phosphatidylserine decarboxylase family protein [Bacteroidales bacterium]
MHIYKNAYRYLYLQAIVLIILNIVILVIAEPRWKTYVFIPAASVILFVLIALFFRVPERKAVKNNRCIFSPADGTVVTLEEVFENEYLKTVCTKISIFMSIFNVHQNIIPVSGKIIYFKHHPGKYIVAWHPKSSIKNEHTSVIIETSEGKKLRISQIAGIIARRIICNIHEGDEVHQGDELGFILFGSRVDLYLPTGANIKIKPGDRVKAKTDIIAEI